MGALKRAFFFHPHHLCVQKVQINLIESLRAPQENHGSATNKVDVLKYYFANVLLKTA